MTKLHTLYAIIPVEDKCSFLCELNEGEFFTTSKGSMTSKINGTKLIFKNRDRAIEFLMYELDPDKYFVEEFGGNDDLYNIAF